MAQNILLGGLLIFARGLHGGQERVVSHLNGINIQDTLRRRDKPEVDYMRQRPSSVIEQKDPCMQPNKQSASRKQSQPLTSFSQPTQPHQYPKKKKKEKKKSCHKTYTVQLTFIVGQSFSVISLEISSDFPSISFILPKKIDVKRGAQQIWSIAVLVATAAADVGAAVMTVRSRKPYQ